MPSFSGILLQVCYKIHLIWMMRCKSGWCWLVRPDPLVHQNLLHQCHKGPTRKYHRSNLFSVLSHSDMRTCFPVSIENGTISCFLAKLPTTCAIIWTDILSCARAKKDKMISTRWTSFLSYCGTSTRWSLYKNTCWSISFLDNVPDRWSTSSLGFERAAGRKNFYASDQWYCEMPW